MRNGIPYIAAGILFFYPPLASCSEMISAQVAADYWYPSSKLNKEPSVDDEAVSLFAAIEHEFSYLPNVKIRYSNVDSRSIDLDKYDFTFYYKLIEDESLHFNAGISASQYTDTQLIDEQNDKYSFDGWVWSLYAAGAIRIPDTAIEIIGEYDFSDRNGKKTADVLAGLEYAFDAGSTKVSLRGGYRVMDYTFTEIADREMDCLINGWFAGVKLAY
ncbi:TIGR04219 family outer membrane beta-barrel protein [Vibrio sp. JC009]|uniref:TIGR04219 family outer membrane beta-barrel protein n=1 Tax=Vibrio sp. JC009 TaxID=2912314 RepID=UPI0023AF57B8|nr:TIGR04219 family outer membrane beta-barrel protein [Vibrio sp. JC009]WED21584.1 TIGR04219 family outer membrane beta-barrel protein [Vibrio sp. JC009]